MNQHTPGPWTVKGVHVGPSKHFRAYSIEPNICEMNSSLAPDDVSANARLIAAAPQLLAALKSLVLSTDGIVSGPESDLCACCGKDYIDEQIRRAEAGEDCIYECTDPDCPRVQAMQAIAQAEGGTKP